MTNQKGLVSIVVSIIIMMILSLITIGFAQLMAREQRQALDRQLSSQAFYAAESGINDALMSSAPLDSLCQDQPTPVGVNQGVVAVSITCVTGSTEVDNIQLDSVDQDPNNPTIIPIETTGISSLTFTWSPTSTTPGSDDFYPSDHDRTDLPKSSDWNKNMGMLRVVLAPFNNDSSRKQMIDAMALTLLYPVNDEAHIFNYGDRRSDNLQFGGVSGATCDVTARICQATIENISSYNTLYIVLSSIYKDNRVTITPRDDAGNIVSLANVQAVIDSTARTSDVVRRIQVRKPLYPIVTVSLSALQATGDGSSDGICKLIRSNINSTSGFDDCGSTASDPPAAPASDPPAAPAPAPAPAPAIPKK